MYSRLLGLPASFRYPVFNRIVHRVFKMLKDYLLFLININFFNTFCFLLIAVPVMYWLLIVQIFCHTNTCLILFHFFQAFHSL